ncbi:putative 2OG-Fe(II) oxygenase [Candidatus Pelagibacter sp.]|uniref:putative 2OG-Fe(II) oxygenase n=1 Tax=Candidatus Pelagibacter sp. TaxID=2024849 RepID=UPI003F847A88
MEFQILRPFGPSIVKLKIPTNIIDDMNKYVDEVVKSDKKSKKLDFGPNLAGNVQQEIFLEIEFMKKIRWAEFLGNSCARWIAYEKNTKLTGFEIIRSWVVRQFKNDYNPIHFHTGHVSGVGYLKVPKNLGETTQKGKNNVNGKLVLVDGSKKLFSNPIFVITPKVGDFYLFPNYLLHAVYPFSDTDDERRSVSFNAKLDDTSASIE